MFRAAVALAACLAGAQLAAAQTNGATAHIVVPFAPGGGQDVLARVVAPDLAAALGETIVVDNRGGAGGAVGTAFVARSKPDGTTLLMAAASHLINSALDPKLPYDPIGAFTAVAHVGSGAMLVLVNAALPVKNVAELIAYAKANPHRLNYASAGVGSATHLAMAYFASTAGIDIVHVPYKSTAEALTHLLSGEAQALIVPTLGSQAYVGNAGVRILAITDHNRLASLKDIPTVRESGLPAYEFISWFGLLGPARMPPDVVAKINDGLGKAMANPAVAAAIEQQGIAPKPLSPAEFARVLDDDFALIKSIVRGAGITAEQ